MMSPAELGKTLKMAMYDKDEIEEAVMKREMELMAEKSRREMDSPE